MTINGGKGSNGGESGERAVEAIRSELAKQAPSKRRRAFEKFFLAALGSIPWVGGFISAAASLKLDGSGIRQDDLQTQWLEEHQHKLDQLKGTLGEIERRFENLGDDIDDRIQSDEYLTLVRRAFRAWDRADTEEKRKYVANLVTNSAGSRICTDDVVRLFIDWLDTYHEAHFAIIRKIYQQPGSTRYEIWTSIYGPIPREDSAEADLYRRLIRELSTGDVIRQERDVTAAGQFVRQRPARRGPRSDVLDTSFDDEKPYVLTALGQQFVHYTMNEVVPRIEERSPAE